MVDKAKQAVQTEEFKKKQIQENQDVEKEIFFKQFEKNPANYA